MAFVLKFENEELGGAIVNVVQTFTTTEGLQEARVELKRCMKELKSISELEPLKLVLHSVTLHKKIKTCFEIIKSNSEGWKGKPVYVKQETLGVDTKTKVAVLEISESHMSTDLTKPEIEILKVNQKVEIHQNSQVTQTNILNRGTMQFDEKQAINGVWFVKMPDETCDKMECAFQSGEIINKGMTDVTIDLAGPFYAYQTNILQTKANEVLLLRVYKTIHESFWNKAQTLAGCGPDTPVYVACTVFISSEKGVFKSKAVYDGCEVCGVMHSSNNKNNGFENFTCERCVPIAKKVPVMSTNVITHDETRVTKSARKKQK